MICAVTALGAMLSSASLESMRAFMLDMLSGKTRQHGTQRLLLLLRRCT
jgi:hypothetical protein